MPTKKRQAARKSKTTKKSRNTVRRTKAALRSKTGKTKGKPRNRSVQEKFLVVPEAVVEVIETEIYEEPDLVVASQDEEFGT